MQQFALRSERISCELKLQMVDSLARQVGYLYRHLETDIGGNHLIKNIKAMLWAGAFFEGKDARRWQSRGIKLLKSELASQVLPDGVHYERSPSYHAQVFADLLECRTTVNDAKSELDVALTKMAQVTIDLKHPDGKPAQFNDAGLTMAYEPETCLKAYFNQTGIMPGTQNLFAYPAAGYFGYRDDRLTLMMDCGALAPDDLPAHGHADMLSFELSLDCQRMIVDQGVYEYIPGLLRTISKAAASHNTLSVDGVDQADFYGSFRFGRRARIVECEWEEMNTAVRLTGAHDGYAVLPGKPVHRRVFQVNSDGVKLIDRLVGVAQPLPAKIGFLLHPEVTAHHPHKAGGQGTWRLTGPQGQMLTVECTEPLSIEDAVWWPDMGQKIATTRLVARAERKWEEIVTEIGVMPLQSSQNNSCLETRYS